MKEKIKLIFSWIFSILLFLFFIVELTEKGYLSSLFLLIASLFIFPPLRKFLKQKYNFSLKTKYTIIIVLVLFIVASTVIPKSQKDRIAEESEELEKARELARQEKEIEQEEQKVEEVPKDEIKTEDRQEEQKEPKQEFISESLRELHSKWFKGKMTDLQKEEFWKEKYEGKYVNWEGFVKDIDKGWLGGYSISITASPPSAYTFTNDAYVKIKKDKVDNLKEYSIGDKIKFQGKLNMYSDLLTVFYVEEGFVTGRASKTQTDNLPPDNELIASCIASGIPYDTCVSAIEGRRY